tara:strand:+ start:1084 stop:2061 length:978 start_codon:yes stop_codon:yes gene_type:complete
MVVKKKLSVEEKLELIRRNTVEIVGEEDLIKGLKAGKKMSIYCGYEPSGPLHLGHFVTLTKLADFAKAGFNVKVLLADLHAGLNRKGSEKEIDKEVRAWRKTLKAMGAKVEVVLGSEFQYDKKYQLDVMKLSQHSTINRGLRSMQEIARDVKNATISQLWYPLMQVVDIKHLKVDVALGGLEQRKVHMIGKDLKREMGYDFVAVHTPLISSLKGPGQKMSSSIPGSLISVTDDKKQVKKAIGGAYCPEGKIEDNPVLQIAKLIVFPHADKLEIKRPDKFGGDVNFKSYEELEEAYVRKKVHPMDLKNAVAEGLEKIIGPIRKNFK